MIGLLGGAFALRAAGADGSQDSMGPQLRQGYDLFRRPLRLRSHLIALFLAAMAPLFLFAVFMIYRSVQAERETFRRGAIERTRAVLTAVDTELNRSISTLEALATAQELDSDDLYLIYQEAARALKSQPDWFTIVLATPDGRQVINLLRPFGSDLPMVAARASFDQVLKTRRPAIGPIFSGPIEPRLNVPVRVPVIRNGEIKYVLTAVLNPHAFYMLLLRQHLPKDWVAGVLDGNQTIVARNIDPERTVGRPAAESLRAALAQSSEGWFRGRTADGRPVYTSYERSEFSGWTFAMGIPTAVVDAPLHGSLLYMALLGLGFLALGVALALWFSRSTARSIESLSRLAEDLAVSKESVDSVPSRISEVERLREAFLSAKRLVQQHSEERNQFERELWQQASLLELSHDAIFVREFRQGEIVYWNRGAEMLYGYSKTEALGQSPRALLKTFHPRGIDFIESSLEENGEWAGELTHTARDGRKVYTDSRHVLAPEADGRRLVLETDRDISERKREDWRREGRLALNAILADAPTLGDAIPKIVETLGQLGQWDMCAMWQLDRATDEWVGVEVWHAPSVDLGEFEAETKGRRIKLIAWTGLLGRVLQSGEPAWLADVTADSYFRRGEAARKHGIHAGFCFPIKLGTEVLGLVECYSREVRAPDPDFVRMLAAIGVQLGHFLERKHAEQELELTSRLPAENPAPVIRLSEGRWVNFNNAAAEPLLTTWKTRIGGEAPVEIAQIACGALADGRRRTIEIAFGDCLYAVTVVPVVEASYVNLYFTDITAIKRGVGSS